MAEPPKDPGAHWRLVQDVFHRALEQPPEERTSFVLQACAEDGVLAGEVLDLLAEDARTQSLLDRPLEVLAHEVLEGTEPPLRRIGPYRILSLLGAGGMGVVYLAERDDLGSRAAIKVLRDATLSPARRERFRLEERILAQLNDPAIARIYDADVLPDGTPYFVMEYVEGLSVTEYCDTHQLTLRERLGLFRDVCSAVQAAHRQAVVHRDLKPSNILVTSQGAPKLLDFGISKSLDTDTQGSAIATGLQLMTPAYAAPEQIRGDPVGVYTDVYALGVLLYELLAGQLPFQLSALAPRQAQDLILESIPDPVSRHLREHGLHARRGAPSKSVRDDLDTLCATAMHRDPARRYSTVGALIRDLDHFLGHEPLDARPDSWWYSTRKFVRRNRRGVLSAAVVASMMLGVVGFFGVRLRNARDLALGEAARTRRIQDFTLGLFSGGDPEVGPADTLRVATLLDRGVRTARALDAEPAVQAELYLTLGKVFAELGVLPRADSLLGEAQRTAEARLGPESPEAIRARTALVLIHTAQNRLEEAEREGRNALEVAERRLPALDVRVLEARFALGKVLQERGDYTEAAVAFAEVARGYSLVGSDDDRAGALHELASTYYYAGELAPADSVARQVLALRRTRYGEAHPYVGDALVNLAAIQNRWGNYEESEKVYREAVRVFTDYYGEDHQATASALTMLSQTLAMEEKFDEALAVTEQSLAVRERVYGPDHPLVATTLSSLGQIALARDAFDDAEAWYRKALDIYVAAYGRTHANVAVSLANLATVYLVARRYSEAEPVLREALEIFLATVSAEDPNIGITRIKLGRVLIRQGKALEGAQSTRAGYDQLSQRSNPLVPWLQSARRDLIDAYEALELPEEAARFRAELEKASAPP